MKKNIFLQSPTNRIARITIEDNPISAKVQFTMAAATMMVVPDVSIKNDDDIEDPTTITTKTKAKGCCSYTKDFLLYDSSNKLNQAFYLNHFGRAMLFITFMFLSLGVLQLANKQADCPTVTDANGNISYTNCGNKVYGMLPSSILSLMAIIGGVATSCFMPYAGAVSEKKRRKLTHDLYISHLSLTHTLLFKSILPPPPSIFCILCM